MHCRKVNYFKLIKLTYRKTILKSTHIKCWVGLLLFNLFQDFFIYGTELIKGVHTFFNAPVRMFVYRSIGSPFRISIQDT